MWFWEFLQQKKNIICHTNKIHNLQDNKRISYCPNKIHKYLRKYIIERMISA